MLQNVQIHEGGAYEASWSREGSQQADQGESDCLGGEVGSCERAAKKARRGTGASVGNATLLADQERRNANLRIETFLTSIETSPITVSRPLACDNVLSCD